MSGLRHSDREALRLAALDPYDLAALDKNPRPRQIMSMFQQAVRVAEIQGNEAIADRLRALFRDNES